jgi:Tol biopolymer transport system component
MTGHRLPFVPLLAGLVAAAAIAAPGGDPPPPRPAPVPAPAPRPVDPLSKGPNQLFFCWGDAFYRCDPDGGNGRVVSHPACHDPHPNACSLSPDGTKVVYVLNIDNRDGRTFKLLVFAADGSGPATDLGDGRVTLGFCWSGDGMKIAVLSADPNGKTPATADIRHEVVDVATGRRTRLDLPRDHILSDWSRDGQRFLTAQFIDAKGDAPADVRLWVMNRDGTPHREIRPPAKMQPDAGRFSPDGRRVLYGASPHTDREHPSALLVCDLASGNSTPVAGVPPGGDVCGCCWSPDGRRIAYTWGARRVEPKPGALDPEQKIESHMIVCDPDGRNRTVVATERSAARNWSFGVIDWR